MNYNKALKLLYLIENPRVSEQEADEIIASKFSYVVAMQRYKSFSAEEKENVDLLLQMYPALNIAYLDTEEKELPDGPVQLVYFSTLINGFCAKDVNGAFIPKYRVQLPGYPILGDGKSDNQNHSLIFCRGTSFQTIR